MISFKKRGPFLVMKAEQITFENYFVMVFKTLPI